MKSNALFAAFAVVALSLVPGNFFAQGDEDRDVKERGEKPGDFNAAVQQDFVILDTPHFYDFNPYTAAYTNEAQIFTGLYEGLYSYNPQTLDPVPALAESHRVSRDKKIWTFTLRKNGRYSNGDPITAESIRQSWLTLLAPRTGAPFASLLDCVVGAEAYRTGMGKVEDVGISARDSRTLIVRLAAPTEHLPRILCHHAFAAIHPSALDLAVPGADPTKGVFSGAFVLADVTDEALRLARNEQYREKEKVALPSITVRMSEDRDENAWLMNTGAAHWSTGAINTDLLLDAKSIKVYGEFATEYLFFKTDSAPWNNAAFRIALLTAVPWDKLRSKALVPAKTFIYPLYGYTSPEGFSDGDKDEAKLLLDQARKDAGVAADAPLSLVFAISDTDYMKEIAELLSDAWEQIGVTLDVETTPSERYLDSIASWDADLFSYIWIGDFADPVAFLELFRSASTLNVSTWSNSDYDRLMAEAASVQDSKKRMEVLAGAEAILLDAGVVIPISHPVSLNVIDLGAVGGWHRNALDIHPFKGLYFTGRTESLPNLVRGR